MNSSAPVTPVTPVTPATTTAPITANTSSCTDSPSSEAPSTNARKGRGSTWHRPETLLLIETYKKLIHTIDSAHSDEEKKSAKQKIYDAFNEENEKQERPRRVESTISRKWKTLNLEYKREHAKRNITGEATPGDGEMYSKLDAFLGHLVPNTYSSHTTTTSSSSSTAPRSFTAAPPTVIFNHLPRGDVVRQHERPYVSEYQQPQTSRRRTEAPIPTQAPTQTQTPVSPSEFDYQQAQRQAEAFARSRDQQRFFTAMQESMASAQASADARVDRLIGVMRESHSVQAAAVKNIEELVSILRRQFQDKN